MARKVRHVMERAVVFARTQPLAGVIADAECGGDRPRPGVVFLNAGLLHRIGPHRLYVEIARRLSCVGFASLRFDLSGIGDSPPRRDSLPFRESALCETREAMDYLAETRGLSRFVLIGLCSGADAAFRVACADPRVVGAVFIDGFPYRTVGWCVRHYTRRLVRWRVWWNFFTGTHTVWRRLPWRRASSGPAVNASADLVGRDIPPKREAALGLRELIRRGVRLLFIYSGGLSDYYNYRSQFAHAFRSVPFDGRVQVEYFEGADHIFTLLASQERLVRAIEDWTRRFS